jgi:hypothetical protein
LSGEIVPGRVQGIELPVFQESVDMGQWIARAEGWKTEGARLRNQARLPRLELPENPCAIVAT